uniref:Uncharacterized protein n=1 Tax=Davidia involucrata TaxID=16924 RepID=A0A5B7ARZ6_DAVIN
MNFTLMYLLAPTASSSASPPRSVQENQDVRVQRNRVRGGAGGDDDIERTDCDKEEDGPEFRDAEQGSADGAECDDVGDSHGVEQQPEVPDAEWDRVFGGEGFASVGIQGVGGGAEVFE